MKHALHQINVNGKLKNAMSEAIEDPNLNIFDDAQKHVYTLMKDGPYKRFILQDNIQDILRGHGWNKSPRTTAKLLVSKRLSITKTSFWNKSPRTTAK